MNSAKVMFLFVVFGIFGPFGSISNELSDTLTIERKESSASHPYIEGFAYTGGFASPRKTKQNDTGYFYTDLDLYETKFTDVSKLFLAHVEVEFTSGYIADNNGEDFDDMYDLDLGYVHLRASRSNTISYQSSTIHFLDAWPTSDNFSYELSSSTGFSVNFGVSGGIDYSLADGASISGNAETGFVFSLSNTLNISGPEPFWSSQTSNNNPLERQWNYEYNGLGKATLTKDFYYLFEVENDATGPNSSYSFMFYIDINMSNVKYKDFWWESHTDTNASLYYSYGVR